MSWEGEETKAIAVAGTTTLVTIKIEEGAEVMYVEIENNSAAQPLDAFAALIRAHNLSAFYTVANTTLEFTTEIRTPIIISTGDPTLLALGDTMLLGFDVRGFSAIRLTASANTAIVSTTARWKMR